MNLKSLSGISFQDAFNWWPFNLLRCPLKIWKVPHWFYWEKSVVPFQNLDSEKEKELERQARIEASLREREREVQKARSEQTKEIDREREQHKREEAIQNFKALLSDMVRHRPALSAPRCLLLLGVVLCKALGLLQFSLYRNRILLAPPRCPPLTAGSFALVGRECSVLRVPVSCLGASGWWCSCWVSLEPRDDGRFSVMLL